ncbi:uncharacterized protein EV420DRAFT_1548539 [Desarmillaria tabescens]|uniref:F-box domain-containing protein n=1 Tax=Armillaria tabescens TaxID=1929756 RepID=A0AA39N501_ARMTA|nr:uncharacterized protein EV420DRAFT_1548539 [Desarmillaria tabescens]KAK0457490.1 hypothetical protein EV420DRAFT_1548539 [Desarmillaria tabescens]
MSSSDQLFGMTDFMLAGSLKSLYENNEPPSNAQENILRAELARRLESLSYIDKKIIQLRTELEAHLHARDAIANEVDTIRTGLHPIRRLPDDILTVIFELCVRNPTKLLDSWHSYDYDSLVTDDAPWTLSHVCRQWRAVAVNTSRLWSCVNLTFSDSEELGNERYLLELQLERLKGHDISLSISNPADDHPLLPLIIPKFIPQCTTLMLNVSYPFFHSLTPYSECFARVTHLALQLNPNAKEPRDMNISIDAFTSLPSLQYLNVTGPIEYYSLPFHNLTEYHGFVATNAQHFEALQMLTQSSSLTRLNLVCHESDIDSIPLETITLPSLRHLSLCEERRSHYDMVEGSLAQIYTCIRLPSLISLKIEYRDKGEHTVFPPLDMSNRCTATTLEVRADLHSTGGSPGDLARFVQSTPNVTDLRIRVDPLSNAFLARLIVLPDPDVPLLLPKLTSLDLRSSQFKSLNYQALISEDRTCSILQEVRLDSPLETFDDEETGDLWRELLEDGLVVKYEKDGLDPPESEWNSSDGSSGSERDYW